MIKAVRIRLLPTKEQETLMWQSVGVMRYIYNWTLNKQQENYKNGGKFISDSILRKELTQLKKLDDYKWIGIASNDVAKQACKDACDSYKKFFKRGYGFPKYKSRKRSKPSFYNDTVKLKVKENKVNLAKIGWVKTSEQIPMNCKYCNPRITYDDKYWYISVGIEIENINVKKTGESIGIDLGVKELAVCSNGLTFKNINKSHKVKKLKKKLKRLQRQVSRKYEANKQGNKFVKTNNIIKLEKQIKLLHRKLSNIRLNHIHQTTNKIIKLKPSRVVMEDLNVKGMMKNKHLSKAIQEQCFYEFIRQMKYKCEFNGIQFIQADRYYPSSKTCSKCGAIDKTLKLSNRTYVCKECGCVIDRDYNASINLSRYKLAN